MSTDRPETALDAFADVAEVRVDPDLGQVYEFGWQSWSPSTTYPVGVERSARPVEPRRQTCSYRPGKPGPARTGGMETV